MAKPDTNKTKAVRRPEDPGRRDFIVIATNAMAGLGAAAVAANDDQVNPAADTLALANMRLMSQKLRKVSQSL